MLAVVVGKPEGDVNEAANRSHLPHSHFLMRQPHDLECDAVEASKGRKRYAAYLQKIGMDSREWKQELPPRLQMAIGMKVTQNMVTDLDLSLCSGQAALDLHRSVERT